MNVDIENWPCAASIACIAAGDRAPEPELLDFFEPGWSESEPDIVNGSVPLPKNPVDCVEDETCEPIDLTTSHAADAAPKAISMIKTSRCRAARPLPHCQWSASVVPDKKRNKSSPFEHGTDTAEEAIAAAAAGFAGPEPFSREVDSGLREEKRVETNNLEPGSDSIGGFRS